MRTRSIYKYSSIATLGNELTCSFFCAKKYCKAKTIQVYNSFEDSANAVRNGISDAFIVPGAYPNIRDFIMDDFFRVQETEVIQIPALVLAGKFPKQPEKIKSIFLHPAPEKLLSEIETRYEERVFVKSNPLACVEVLSHVTNSIALTNENSAIFYGLTIYRILRPGIFMPFVLFVSA